MTHYIGFKPSEELSNTIDEAERIVKSDSKDPYYPFRNIIAQKIAYEIIENFLNGVIDVIPDAERKQRMHKIIGTIEGAAEKMLNILLGKDKNADVIPNITYLEEETVFDDEDGNRRIGFELKPHQATSILEGLNAVSADDADIQKLLKGLKTLNHAVVEHFVVRFSETLPLGMLKRKAVPMAKAGINKALDIAINKIVPTLPIESLNALVEHYKTFVVEK